MIPRPIFDSYHEIFRDSLKRFIADEILPNYADWEAAGIAPRSIWQKAGEQGFLCTNVPEEYGGMGGDFLHSAIMIEEMARAGCTTPTFYLHSEIISPYLVHFGTEEQKSKWLPGMARGDVITSLGMSEPGGGSDVQNIKTTAIRDGDDYVINGQKTFITSGFNADLVVLACKTDPSLGAKGVSLILVETDRPGFERGRMLQKIGCKGQDTAELFFSDLRVPVGNLLGEEGKGFAILMQELAQERLVQAIRAVSSAEAAVEWTIEYATDRKMFGQTLADFQNTQFKLAELTALLATQRVFVDRCTELHMKGELDSVDAAMAKMVTTELQFKVMDECLQLHGGWGYMTEYPIARAFVDARLGRIGGGSIETMKSIIAKSIMPSLRKRRPT
ncbi:acyl-CoA dehydrogenase family protein [Martelella sp. AMO21009]